MVVKNQSDWIDQMSGHEIVDHEKKTQHIDTKVGLGTLMWCVILSIKNEIVREVKIHDEIC